MSEETKEKVEDEKFEIPVPTVSNEDLEFNKKRLEEAEQALTDLSSRRPRPTTAPTKPIVMKVPIGCTVQRPITSLIPSMTKETTELSRMEELEAPASSKIGNILFYLLINFFYLNPHGSNYIT